MGRSMLSLRGRLFWVRSQLAVTAAAAHRFKRTAPTVGQIADGALVEKTIPAEI